MTLRLKKTMIFCIAMIFLLSLVFVQWMEAARREVDTDVDNNKPYVVSERSQGCIACHTTISSAIVQHWKDSAHAVSEVGCYECHQARHNNVDAFDHYGSFIVTIVTPRDCAQCHPDEAKEFQNSHHAAGGNILASLDNFLAETVEGASFSFPPFSLTPGKEASQVDGMASSFSGCQQCHGSKVGLQSIDGKIITVDDLQPDSHGNPTNQDAVDRIARDSNDKPIFRTETWPNTGIGRLNLDGSRGACSACHSRHDFSPRRARRPENCGRCHLGPDHPQKEIYEESKHGVAYRDLHDKINIDAKTWILGKDYSQAPTCATCHLSRHTRNNKITHDPGERISWSNRPPISLSNDTDAEGKIVKDAHTPIVDSAMAKRDRMKDVCSHCHVSSYVDAFYEQYDKLVALYHEKFAKPGQKIMETLTEEGLLSNTPFDEKIKWTWFYLWHHEGRRARHGAAMMAPDYTHWHGMFEVSERFYMELIPEARAIADKAAEEGKEAEGRRVHEVIDAILGRPEHQWFLSH